MSETEIQALAGHVEAASLVMLVRPDGGKTALGHDLQTLIADALRSYSVGDNHHG